MRTRTIASALCLLLVAPATLSAAAATRTASPQPIYAAFSLIKNGNLRRERCGSYSVTYGTYTGRSASPDPRLAGAVRYVGRIAVQRGGSTGIATGTISIRDGGGRTRTRAGVTGVVTQGGVVNGLVSGSVRAPAARLLANVTMVFDERLGFAAVRLGLESGANTAVAYSPLPRC